LEPQSKEYIFLGYPKGLKGYLPIYPSTENLIIERSVGFEEIPMHASQKQHEQISLHPRVAYHRDDESYHSYQIYDMISKYDLEYQDHGCEYPNPRLTWAQSILHEASDLVGDPADPRRRSQFVESPHALTSIELVMSIHFYMVIA
jgi:hypothetical protein